MNVVIWARVSSREQREGYSIDAQLGEVKSLKSPRNTDLALISDICSIDGRFLLTLCGVVWLAGLVCSRRSSDVGC